MDWRDSVRQRFPYFLLGTAVSLVLILPLYLIEEVHPLWYTLTRDIVFSMAVGLIYAVVVKLSEGERE